MIIYIVSNELQSVAVASDRELAPITAIRKAATSLGLSDSEIGGGITDLGCQYYEVMVLSDGEWAEEEFQVQEFKDVVMA